MKEVDTVPTKTTNCFGGDAMKLPEVVEQILYLREKGWGAKRISKQLQVSRNTVRRYVRQGGWVPYQASSKQRKLDGLKSWLEEQFYQHKGNAAVLKQELLRQHQKKVGLRTIQYAVKSFRQKLFAEVYRHHFLGHKFAPSSAHPWRLGPRLP